MPKLIYLTFNDPPGGIFFSQVTDVCRFINHSLQGNIQLISFISIRKFIHNRKQIKNSSPGSLVIPMFPGVNNWRLNYLSLMFVCMFIRPSLIIARGPFSCLLALKAKKKFTFLSRVCFDARGAYTAEFNEYDVSGNPLLKNAIRNIEREAILYADFRLSVSHNLVEYWRKEFNYKQDLHRVIPCTLNSYFSQKNIVREKIVGIRKELNLSDTDILCVYSGSSAAWQSLKLVDDIFLRHIQQNKNIKLLFLTGSPVELKVASRFPGNVMVKSVPHTEMFDMLSAGDYGILIREESTTNRVASPTKFSEYLCSGLRIIISEGTGDYPEFVREHGCGSVIRDNMLPDLIRVSGEEKVRLNKLARQYFSKESYSVNYKALLGI